MVWLSSYLIPVLQFSSAHKKDFYDMILVKGSLANISYVIVIIDGWSFCCGAMSIFLYQEIAP